jgi:prevent-host-death family protein
MLNISTDIRSLSDFKRNTSEFVEQIQATGHPLVLTINGKAEIVVQDATAYQKLLDRIDQLEALEGIKRGLADVHEGRVTSVEKFEWEFRKSIEYRVALADSTKAGADALYARIIAAAPLHGSIWFDNLLRSIRSWYRMPQPCPLAR